MGAVFGSSSAYEAAAAAAAAKEDEDDTVKWYLDTNAGWTVGVPMAPPLPTDTTKSIPTSRVTWKIEPIERHRLMIIEVDYPLLESADAIQLSKVRIGPSGQQVEALGWESQNKVFADTDDHFIQIEAPLYRSIDFKAPHLRVVVAEKEWLQDRKVFQLNVYFHGGKK